MTLDVCKRGHERDEDNAWFWPSGSPRCGECARASQRAYRARFRAQHPLPPRVPRTDEERFLALVLMSSTGCLMWQGAGNGTGYGVFRSDGRNILAHRWAYEHFVGPIPDGFQVDHLCRIKMCVNYEGHLQAVTPLENTRRVFIPAQEHFALLEAVA